MRGLKDKVAIVTGAAGRIGKSVVRRLVEEEARVVAADINVDAAQALVAEFGSQAIAIGFDSADEASIKALMDQTMAHFGSIDRSEENTSELQSLMRTSYAVFCLNKKKIQVHRQWPHHSHHRPDAVTHRKDVVN